MIDFLLYKAAEAGQFGRRQEFPMGSITDALFVYLDGAPDPESIHTLDTSCRQKPLVCLTKEWEDHIRANYPQARIFTRYLMKPAAQFHLGDPIRVPEGFTLAPFDEKTFALHPFSHGENYPAFSDFQKQGAGTVVWHKGTVVASASSFLTLDGEVELDVSTEEAHRGLGLASACVQKMLADCEERGITVHWDAQNETSRHLAEKFGFTEETSYLVYFLPE